MVSTDVSGLVKSVDVKEGQLVPAGQLLFEVDPLQFQIALSTAKANLEQVRLMVASAMEDYKRLQSDIAAQTAQVQLAQTNYTRAESLYKVQAGSKATYDQALYAMQGATETRSSLISQAQSALIKLGGRPDLPIEQQPQYVQALGQVNEAQRELDHTSVRAPFSGRVTGVDALQPGTFLVSQTAALTNTGAIGLVSDTNVWATANMKETDLTYLKVGDPATVSVDAYPGRTWRGRVSTIFPATGSEFSILPSENSSGNWVKVVQRVPVRVTLDQAPGDPQLRAGMSVTVDIDTGRSRHWSDLWSGWTTSAATPVAATTKSAAPESGDADQR
jgi:membrane fusion protein, multidrug efflux system